MLDDHARDRKAEAASLRLRGERIAHLAEALENRLAILRRDPRPVVGDGEADAVRVGFDGEPHQPGVPRRELDGIGQQIDDDLEQPVAVGDGGRYTLWQLDFQRDALVSWSTS